MLPTQKFEREIKERAKKLEFSTFLLGVVLPLSFEEKLSEKERLAAKSEIKRTLGQKLEKEWKSRGIRADFTDPDVRFTLDFYRKRLIVEIKPLYIYGRYLKYSRKIPQSKWPCRKCNGSGCRYCNGEGAMYSETVEGLVAKPLLKATGASSTKMHAVGREDIDARMLGSGRPFVLELAEPKKRKITLGKFEDEINRKNQKKIAVKGLRLVPGSAVHKVKAVQPNKTYVITVSCPCTIPKPAIAKLLQLKGKTILQQTPERVLHRRADLARKRKIIRLSAKQIDKNTLELTITAQSGTYVKELVTGDKGRTVPSVSKLLGCACKPKNLDVIEVDFELE